VALDRLVDDEVTDLLGDEGNDEDVDPEVGGKVLVVRLLAEVVGPDDTVVVITVDPLLELDD